MTDLEKLLAEVTPGELREIFTDGERVWWFGDNADAPDYAVKYIRHSDHLAAMQDKDARIAELEAALAALVKLNDEWAPFGGEIYQDRIERTWSAARAALQRKSGERGLARPPFHRALL